MLNSGKYLDSIIESLTHFRQEIASKVRLGFTDLNKHSEDFIKEVLNITYGLRLVNLSDTTSHNYPGLDLGDKEKRIAYQVTSTKSGSKIEETLKTCIETRQYTEFISIYFFILTQKQKKYSIKTDTESYFKFSAEKNIIDFDDLFRDIKSLSVDKKEALDLYIKKEFSPPRRIERQGTFTPLLLNKYLKTIVASKKNTLLDNRYVNIYSHLNADINIECIGVEVLNDDLNFKELRHDYFFLDNNINTDDEINDEGNTSNANNKPGNEEKQPRIDTILNISKDTQRFVVIGEPGSGKTTTLKKILYQNAKAALEDSYHQFPVFIAAGNYGREGMESLEAMIAHELGIVITDVELILKTGNLQLLIDGINEVDIRLRYKFDQNLLALVNDYDTISVIISARKHNFKKTFPVPVFELKELREGEIKEFIYKHNPAKADSIWNELTSNYQIMRLAHNPLMLFMILGASRSGEIPKTKGTLYDFFVMNILDNEFKKSGNTRETYYDNFENYRIERLNVLCFIAFHMKKLGRVNIPAQLVNDHVVAKYPYVLFNELLDSPLLMGLDDIYFYHESFLDYFCALLIKTKIESHIESGEKLSLEDIGIEDMTENRWYEPLIMCGDLFVKRNEKESYAGLYLELLSNKIINVQKEQKPLTVIACERYAGNGAIQLYCTNTPFDVPDFNENLLIFSKVAYNFRSAYPLLYAKAEKTILNYLSIWIINYKKGKILFPLGKLLAAVSGLSSTTAFEMVLLKLNWQEVWLCSHILNDDNCELPNPLFVNTNEEVFFSFIDNVSDFDVLFGLLDGLDNEETNYFFSRVKWTIARIKNALLVNSNINDLKKSYLRRQKNLHLLNYIGKFDIEFFIAHYDTEWWGAINLLEELLEHLNEPVACDTVLQLLDTHWFGKDVIKNVVKVFLSSESFHKIFPYIEKRLATPGESKNFFLEQLKSIPFNKLSLNLRKQFKTSHIPLNNGTVKCQYSRAGVTKTSKSIKIKLGKLNFADFLVLQKYKSAYLNGYKCYVRGFEYFGSNGKMIALKHLEDGNWENVTCVFVIKGLYKPSLDEIPDSGILETGDNIGLELPGADIANVVDLKLIEGMHPDMLAQNKKFMQKLAWRTQMHGYEKYREMVRQYNWVYKFHELLTDVTYGVVLQRYNHVAHIYIISTKEVYYKTHVDETIQENDIIVVEKNGAINSIEDKRSVEVGYIKSHIMRLDYDRLEGHIYRQSKKGNEKDYYFHFNDCDDKLNVGDIVSFVPAINLAFSSYGLPKAYKVKREKEVNKCKIVTVGFNATISIIYGTAIDISTDRELYYTVPLINGEPRYFKKSFTKGQVYSYKPIVTEGSLMSRIKLLEYI